MRKQKWVITVFLILVAGSLRGQTVSPPAAQDTPAIQPPTKPIGPVRISGGVMAGLLLTKVDPVYPSEAQAEGIGGTVVLHVIIGKDGTIEKLKAISGPDLLQKAAEDAVSHWTYKPYLLNGEPTEVDTTVTVNFNLHSLPPDTPPHDPDKPVLISGSVTGGLLIHATPPVAPAIAMAAHVSGSVVLRVIIGKDGSVRQVQTISGPDMLKQAAVDAVKQWRYKPYLLNGQPTAVDTTVTVNFQK